MHGCGSTNQLCAAFHYNWISVPGLLYVSVHRQTIAYWGWILHVTTPALETLTMGLDQCGLINNRGGFMFGHHFAASQCSVPIQLDQYIQLLNLRHAVKHTCAVVMLFGFLAQCVVFAQSKVRSDFYCICFISSSFRPCATSIVSLLWVSSCRLEMRSIIPENVSLSRAV